MKIDGILSVRDFFHYYFSGFLWIINLGLVYLLITNQHKSAPVFTVTNTVADNFVLGIFLAISPYTLGFILAPLGEIVRVWWQGGKKSEGRTRFPDPRRWLLDHSENYLEGKKISQKEAKAILGLITDVFK